MDITKITSAFALAAGLSLSLASCTADIDNSLSSPARDVQLSVTINRDGNNTRSILSEQGGDLVSTWEDDDLILVTDAGGNYLGVLGNETKSGSSSETFSGTITTTATGSTSLNFLYLGKKTESELKGLGSSVVLDYSSQGGTLDWISKNDFFSKTQSVEINNSVATINALTLERQIAFGHFSIDLDGATYSGQAITISGPGIYTQATVTATNGVTFSNANDSDSGTITITGGSADFYVTFLPKANDPMTPTFSVTIGDVTYSATLDSRQWSPSEFVRASDGSAKAITLSAPEPAEPEVVTTVGPTLTINGKNYRLMKGNLYFDTSTRTFGVFETQLEFVNKIGNNTSDSSTTPSGAPAIVDLFGWGATGYQNARQPDYYTTLGGDYFPSTTSSDNSLSTIRNTQFDWGYVYQLQVNDGLTYLTPTSSEIAAIFANRYYRNATVLGVKGLLVCPVSTAAEAITWITNYGEYALTSLGTTYANDYTYIKITNEDNWSKMEEDGAIFFSGAGHFVTGTSAYSGDVYYWSASGSQKRNWHIESFRWFTQEHYLPRHC